MSNQLLKFIAGKKPLFHAEYAILSAPVRHVFMIAAIWYLNQNKNANKNKQQTKNSNNTNPAMHILEIGSWVGASALSFAQGLCEYNNAMGSITCVDAWQPFFNRETHQDRVYEVMENALQSETAYHLFLHNTSTLPDSITCQHFRGMSQHILPLLQDNTFDIIFIDADHAYTPVKADIVQSLRLVKEGGIICGDDLNLQLSQVDQTIAKENCECDLIKDKKLNRNYHPGVTLAVGEVFGDVSSWGGFWAMQKHGKKWRKISFAGMPVVFPQHFPADAKQQAADHLQDIAII